MGSREPLLVEVSTHDSHAVMRLIGELDLSTAPLVVEGARDLVGVTTLLDLSGLKFMDAVGLVDGAPRGEGLRESTSGPRAASGPPRLRDHEHGRAAPTGSAEIPQRRQHGSADHSRPSPRLSVDPRGVEPLTSWLPAKRSTS